MLAKFRYTCHRKSSVNLGWAQLNAYVSGAKTPDNILKPLYTCGYPVFKKCGGVQEAYNWIGSSNDNNMDRVAC